MSIRNDLISRKQCSTLLQLLELRYQEWDVNEDSIDGRSMDQFNVLERGFIHDMALYDMAIDHIERSVSRAIKEFSDTDLYLYWIFIRRYGTEEGRRDRLMPHRDNNELTVNILLDEDFEGGELYVMTPNSSLEIEYDGDVIENEYDAGTVFMDYFETVDHEGNNSIAIVLSNLTRHSCSPGLRVLKPEVGTTVIHSKDIVHGVAPVTRGVRHTLIFFYRPVSDMTICLADDKKYWDEMDGECYCIDEYAPDFTVEVVNGHYPCVPQ
jgi:hypothetical protein